MGREEGIISLIGGFMRAKRARLEKLLEGQGVHPGQAPMMFAIFNNEGLTQRELGEKMHLRPASVTIMLRRLQRAGFIEKRLDQKDLRVFRIFLTDKGRAVKEVVKGSMEAVEKDACSRLSDDELSSLRRLVSKMKEGLEAAQAFEEGARAADEGTAGDRGNGV